MTAPAKTDWQLRGEWFDVCSCKLPCPCSFAQAPTHGDCLFTLVWHVHEGHYGDTDLSGLGVVALGEFEGNMWINDPNATMTLMFYIDSKADAGQRRALERIFTGQEGGWPGEFGSLIGELRSIEYAPITFDAAPDLTYWQAEIPGKVDVRVEADRTDLRPEPARHHGQPSGRGSGSWADRDLGGGQEGPRRGIRLFPRVPRRVQQALPVRLASLGLVRAFTDSGQRSRVNDLRSAPDLNRCDLLRVMSGTVEEHLSLPALGNP